MLRGPGTAGAGNVATLAVVDIGNRGAAHHALLGQFGDCEQRDTVDNLCNSPGDVPKFSGFDASSLTGDCSKTDGVRGGLEWRFAFLENPGSYDGYTSLAAASPPPP